MVTHTAKAPCHSTEILHETSFTFDWMGEKIKIHCLNVHHEKLLALIWTSLILRSGGTSVLRPTTTAWNWRHPNHLHSTWHYLSLLINALINQSISMHATNLKSVTLCVISTPGYHETLCTWLLHSNYHLFHQSSPDAMCVPCYFQSHAFQCEVPHVTRTLEHLQQ